MSSSEKTVQYTALEVGDKVQEGDQWLDEFGKWQPYVLLYGVNRVVGYGVRARRPISATQPTTYEEVPGSRTLQQAVEQPQRERWAYEELQPGDVIQEGDEWQHENGRWHPFTSLVGSCVQVRHTQRARRPYKISTLLEIGDALANAQKAATQLQDERDEAHKALTQMLAQLTNQTEVLTEVRADEKRLFDDLERLRGEYIRLQGERDETQTALIESRLALKRKVAEVMEVCKERDDALTALKSAQRARDELQLQVDELRSGLMGVVSAEHVHSMLEDMLDQTEWVGQCLDSSTFEQMSCIQRTISVIAERVNDMGKEGTSADA